MNEPISDRAFSPPRRFGALNTLGLWTLYRKEVQRFWKVMFQTVFAPVVTTLLFFAVINLAFGDRRGDIGGIPFSDFLAPGLILMGLLQNAFANSSSSILVSKVQGNSVDFLMPPLSALELMIAFIAGAVTRGVVVAIATAAVMAFFVDLTPDHIWAIVFYALMGAMLLGMIGLIGGVWAEKFDHVAVITNFIITPLTFLSGTFYSISVLPEPFFTLSHFNPFFYMIDGFRYGFTGHADGSILIGAIVLIALNLVMLAASYAVLRSGWRLKS
ncbi:ABC transporter permease [Hyphobacterium sp.]|uniref:ABC transporter permease n=1 Tax=Hyphobacterium sp. TaxID=2004662 RepID=UPI003BAB988E